ncbi:MAG: DUF1552 domain-containing protein [Deltaproteobacteria bacterium]|nr:DUF1552 domain-containing protein [Nannocystaceae bacterium]
MLTRRAVLMGAGGFTLALPFLPSLQPRAARAGGPLESPKRFVALVTGHGGSWESQFFPDVATTPETMQYAGRTIRRGALTPTEQDGMTSLSRVLRAPTTELTPALLAKMNVIRGIDSIIHIGHNAGGMLGNPNATDDATTASLTTPRPTIDQLLAYSDWFYSDLTTNLERSMLVGSQRSYGWSSPDSQGGAIQALSTYVNPQELFARIFVPDDAPVEANPRPLVVDRVLEHYHSIRDGNRRLSAGDKQRLDDHMERMLELQRKLSVVVECGDVAPPAVGNVDQWNPPYLYDPVQHEAWAQAVSDVFVAAFLCDTSRIAVLSLNDLSTFTTYQGDWHQDIAHLCSNVTLPADISIPALYDLPQNILNESYQRIFERVFLDLVRKLDVDDGNGQTVLDGTFVMWTQECGPATHECTNLPIVTAGGAGGAIATGYALDYRNLQLPYQDTQYGTPNAHVVGTDELYMGLSLNQYLGTVLQAMGLPPEAYEESPGIGYGEATPSQYRVPLYPQAVLDAMGERLPWLSEA